jgi:hypothetical protein
MTDPDYLRYARGDRDPAARQAKADYMRERRRRAMQTARAHTATSNGNRGSHGNAWAPGASRHVAAVAVHGTLYGYDEAGCRCRECTTAKTAAVARWRQRRHASDPSGGDGT